MQKKFSYYEKHFLSSCCCSISSIISVFTGCSKITLIDVDPTNDTLEHSNNDIVCMLSQLPITANVCSEIASVINRSVRSGFDEDFLFKELWSTDTKVSSTQNCLLRQYIDEYLQQNAETKSGIESMEEILKNTNISIYWPYCEDWDGKTLPTITCPPEDETQEWNYGYKLNEVNDEIFLDTIKVDEEYAMYNPVWIIKDTDYNYSDLPSFINEIYFSSEETSQPSGTIMTKTDCESMNAWVMTSMTVSKQYDEIFWSGGSEFRIAASFPTATGYAGSTNTFIVSFTRKQIRDRTPKSFNNDLNSDNVLNYNWTENQYTNGLAIWEINGKKTNIDYTMGCTVQAGDSTKVSVSATVKISQKDELITSREYTRGYMFSSKGRETQKYDGGNIQCTYDIVNYND